MPRLYIRVAVITAVFCLGVPSAEDAVAQATGVAVALPARHETLVIGRTSESPRKVLPRLQKLGDYLAVQLESQGVKAVEVMIAPSSGTLAEGVAAGRIDVVFDTLNSAVMIGRRSGAEIVLREWRDGSAQYRALIVVRRDSALTVLTDLIGRRIAFEDASSTSGFHLPAAMLRSLGKPLTFLASREDSPSPGSISYYFANQEANVVAHVARGIADAGAISDADWANPERVPTAMREEMRVLGESPPIIRSVVMVRGDLAAPVRQRLIDVLVGIADSDEGREALRGFFGVTRYDRIEGETAEQLERSIKLLGAALKSQ